MECRRGVWSPSWLGGTERGTCGASTLSHAAPFYLPAGGPGSVARGGWQWHRLPGVLSNDADTAHGVQFFDMYNFATLTSDAAQENRNRSAGTDDVVRA